MPAASPAIICSYCYLSYLYTVGGCCNTILIKCLQSLLAKYLDIQISVQFLEHVKKNLQARVFANYLSLASHLPSFLPCLLSSFLATIQIPYNPLPVTPISSFALLCCHKKNSQETDSCFSDCSCKKAANPAAAVAAALKSAKISLLLVVYTGSYFRVFQIPSRISSSVVNR
jgi:hypothetical protein